MTSTICVLCYQHIEGTQNILHKPNCKLKDNHRKNTRFNRRTTLSLENNHEINSSPEFDKLLSSFQNENHFN